MATLMSNQVSITLLCACACSARIYASRVAEVHDKISTEVVAVHEEIAVNEDGDAQTNRTNRGRHCQRIPICYGVASSGKHECSKYPGAVLRCDEFLADVRGESNIPHPAKILHDAGLSTLSVGEGGAGKSGANFLSTPDNRILLKTMTEKDLVALKNFVAPLSSKSASYMSRKSSALLVKYYAVVMIPTNSSEAMSCQVVGPHCKTWLIMNNFAPIDFKTNVDLKGSEAGRDAKLGESILKDNDVRKKNVFFGLSPQLHTSFLNDVTKDSETLAAGNLMDYSMIVSCEKYRLPVCDNATCQAPVRVAASKTPFIVDALRAYVPLDGGSKTKTKTKGRLKSKTKPKRGRNTKPSHVTLSASHFASKKKSKAEASPANSSSQNWNELLNLLCIPFWNVTMQRNDGCHVTVQKTSQKDAEVHVMCYGIIDLLKDFDTRAWFEAAGKKIASPILGKGEASAVNPKRYAKRFLSFMRERFQKNVDLYDFVLDATACDAIGAWRQSPENIKEIG